MKTLTGMITCDRCVQTRTGTFTLNETDHPELGPGRGVVVQVRHSRPRSPCGPAPLARIVETTLTPPPDPDEQNDDRASWAAAALAGFMETTGTDIEDALADLMADLRHWCDRHGQDFDHQLKRSRGMYQDETLD